MKSALINTPFLRQLYLFLASSAVLWHTSSAVVWEGNTDGSWITGSNWIGGSYPDAIAATADFDTASANTTIISVDAADGDITVGNLRFINNGAHAFTLNNNKIIINQGFGDTISNVSALTHTINSNVDITNVTSFETGSNGGTIDFAGTLNLGAPLTASGSSHAEFSGSITGGNSLTWNSSGTGTLSGTHSAGGITVTSGATFIVASGGSINDSSSVSVAGNLQFDVSDTIANATGAGNVTLGNGVTLTLGGNNTSGTTSAVIGDGANTGHVAKTGSGAVTLSGANTYDGTTTVNQGTLKITNTSALGSTTGGTTVNSTGTLEIGVDMSAQAEALTLAGGTLLNTSGADRTWSGTVNASSGTSTLNDGGNTMTLSGVVSGSGAINKSGSGTVTLSNTNTNSGTLTVTAGIVNVTGSIANAPVTVNSGAQLTLNSASSNNISSTLTIGGTVLLSQSNQIGDTVNLNVTGGTLQLGNNTETVNNITDTGSFILDMGGTGGTFVFNSITDGTLNNSWQIWNYDSDNSTVTFGSKTWNSTELANIEFFSNSGGTSLGTGAVDGNNLVPTAAIPEPSTWLSLSGLLLFGYLYHRRRKGQGAT